MSKNKLVYSTNPDILKEDPLYIKKLPNKKQTLKIYKEKKGRSGKTVIIITGFIGLKEDLKTLSKFLKTKCGVGGTVKEKDIIIQGDIQEKIISILKKEGYNIQKR